MTATLWIDTDKDETIELGPTLPFYAAFARLGRIEGAHHDYPELFGVVTATELQDDVDPDWLVTVRDQARKLLAEHGAGIDAHARTILEALAGEDAAKHSELPPVRQEEPWSCGAAALRSVLAHYGRDVPEARLRDLLGSSPESGTPPAAMLAGARRLGLDASMKEGMTLPELERCLILGQPIIMCLQAQEGSAGEVQRLEAGHWVVAQRKRDGRYEFMDPALGGTGYLTRQQLLERWRDRDGDGREYRRLGIVVRGKEQSGEP